MPTHRTIKTAVIVGGHGFDVIGFHNMFRELPGVAPYIQNLEEFAADARNWPNYDVLAFYNMHRAVPSADGSRIDQRARAALEHLGETGQGILVLHHAILAYPDWGHWSDIVGMQERSFGYYHGRNLHVEIADSDHPITRALSPWNMVDETYTMNDVQKSEGNHPLLSVDHPESMKTIAWTRTFKASRVLCFQSGHDNETFVNPGFRSFLARGIAWLSG